MEPDKVALVISALGATFACASLWISAMSYRRGRPQVRVKDAGVVVKLPQRGHDARGQESGAEMLVHALLVNRGQAPVQLSPAALSVEFQLSRKRNFRHSPQARSRASGIFAPLASTGEHATIGGFAGLEVSAVLPEQVIEKATSAWLWRMRMRIVLSSGDVVLSRWFETPTGDEALQARRRAELRAEAEPAWHALSQVVRHVRPEASVVRRAGLNAEALREMMSEGHRAMPTWPTIAKVADVYRSSHQLEFWWRRWEASLNAAMADDEIRTDPLFSEPR